MAAVDLRRAQRGWRTILVQPPGKATEDEREFVQWLQAVSWQLIHADLGHVDLTPVINERGQILVRTDPLDPLTFERVKRVLEPAQQPHVAAAG